MKLRIILALLLVAMLTVALVACADEAGDAGADGEIEIAWMIWGAGAGSPDPIDQLIQRTADNFNALDNGITIDLQWTSGDVYYTRLPALIAAGTVPDIFATHAAGVLQTYTNAGRVLALNEFIDTDPEWRDHFIDGAFRLMTFDGNIYAIPWYYSAVPLFYNMDIFEAHGLVAPETYDDLLNVIAVLRDAGVTPFAFGARDAWTPALFMSMVANRIGGDGPFDAIMAGGGSWLDPSYIEAGYIMQELANVGAFPDDFMGLGADDMAAMFKAGEAAMYVMGSWAIAQVYADDSTVQGSISATKFPTLPGGVGDPNVWLGQPSITNAVSIDTPHPEAVMEFLKYWTSDEHQIFLGEAAGQIPATRVSLNPDAVSPLALYLNALIAESSGMFIFYDVGLGRAIGDEYNNVVQAILAMSDITQTLQNFQIFTDEVREAEE